MEGENVYEPSQHYLSISDLDIKNQKKLLILDLNGTLISRCKKSKNSPFFARTYIYVFLDYIFANFNVMVWSSAQEETVNRLSRLFEDRPLLLKWHRGHFRLTPQQFHSNVETIKNLEWVWEELPEYNATNTVIIDDSTVKLSLQPFNLVKVSTFDHTKGISDTTLLQLMDYLKVLKDEPNVAFYIKNNPFIEVEASDEFPIEFDANGNAKRPRDSKGKKVKKPRHKKLKKALQESLTGPNEAAAESSRITESSGAAESSRVAESSEITESSRITGSSEVCESSKVSEPNKVTEPNRETEPSTVKDPNGLTEETLSLFNKIEECLEHPPWRIVEMQKEATFLKQFAANVVAQLESSVPDIIRND